MVGVTSDVEWIKWREASRSAIGAGADRTGLLGLWGVGYPMATAILSVLLPTTFPVMDRWAVQTVFGRQPNGKPISDSKWQRAAAYESYARHLSSEG